jgi:hypothetical protein
MKTNKLLSLALLSCALIFSSCEKEEEPPTDTTPTPTANTPATINPAGPDAFGALIAIQTANYVSLPFVGEINQPINTGVGFFGNVAGGTFVDAGAVTINNLALSKQSNNSYVFTPAAANPTGPDLSDAVSWNVTGNAANSVPAISNFIPPISFPTAPKYDGSTSIQRTASFTVASATEITGADTTYFTLFSPTTFVQKRVPGNIQSVTFTSDEMGTLGAGTGFVQIASYKMFNQTFDGKKIYFVNQSVVTKSATFN